MFGSGESFRSSSEKYASAHIKQQKRLSTCRAKKTIFKTIMYRDRIAM